MNKFNKVNVIVSLCLSCNLAWADKISGGPRADFSLDELKVPCVKVVNSNEPYNDQFFDVIFKRRGNSFNYELIFAERENDGYCQKVADFSAFEDDDFDDDSNTSGNSADIFLRCEKRSDRSKISVDAKNLASGSYSATVRSGDNNEASSQLKTTVGDEVEFDFDSDDGDIAEGATEISFDFIQDDEVTAEILDENGSVVRSATALCTSK